MPGSNDQDVRLRDLSILEIVLAEHSLTRAAERLELTQPTISKVLTRLRAHFQDPLLVRDGNRMRPTPRAAELVAPLGALLRAAEGIRRPARGPFDPAASDRRFRMLLTDVGMIRFLPPLTARLAAAGPSLHLEAIPLDSRHFEAKLAAGEADLALGSFPRAPRGLRRQRLYADRYVSVVRRSHPQLRRLRTPAGFRGAHHIVVTASETGHGAHRAAQGAVEAAIPRDRVLLRLPSFVAAAAVASRTDGVATIPANLAGDLGRLGLAAFRPPIAIPPIEVAQYWHERFQRDPGHRWLRQLCASLFGQHR
ncbi:MAG TPA: LysR family transcriptional regulator [Kofleriaceae bacterium]|nr:LysR family transcriptional regulator [Kofleriaceae bacterium]